MGIERAYLFPIVHIDLCSRQIVNALNPFNPGSEDNYRALADSDLDQGRGNEGLKRRGEVFPVLGEAPVASKPSRVLSTTQRRGSRAKPLTSSLRLTISRRSAGTSATAAFT